MAKTTKKSTKKTAKQNGTKNRNHQSTDYTRIYAVACFLLALFLFVAIVSFFAGGELEYKEDWSQNWLGWLGGALSTLFVKHVFGISSIGFSLMLVSFGLHLFRVAQKGIRYDQGLAPEIKKRLVLPLNRTCLYSLFWMAWMSVALGYVNNVIVSHGNEPVLQNYAGAVGVVVANGLVSVIRIFTPILILALAGIMVFFVHHVKFPSFQRSPKEDMSEADDNQPVEEKVSLFGRVCQKISDQFAKSVEENEETAKEEVQTDSLLTSTPQPTPPAEEVPFRVNHPSFEETEKTPQQEETVKFDIDDEFERINRKARGEQAGEPSFTVIENNPDAAQSNDEGEPKAEHHVELVEGHLIDTATGEELPPYDPHLDLKDYQMPRLDILEDWEKKNVKVTKEELIANKDRIVQTLRNYGIEIVEISASPGPTVTLYEIKPAPGIRISKIKSLEDDIALSLAALGIRIIAPIPGKSAVGIEVPNAKPQIVSMKTMLASDVFRNSSKMELPIALGKTISNEPYVTDLAKMPHLLMAGATGTGKSVGLNAIIASLLFKKHPSELKFVMVDPKKVELSLYSKIERHYLAKMPDESDAIITDVKKVVRTLNSLCIEMDQRYELLKQAQVRKITEYNEKFKKRMLNPENGHRFLPYIVLVIDEFADLIMTAGKEVELPICRLAQLARAVGIHLIIATQRPTTNIITGTIKTNFPARIAFRVTSAIDSRTILDTGGANQLIGRGDMLISLAGSDMVRLQCALIETEEIDRLGSFIAEQRGYPEGFLLPEYLDENEEPNKEFDPRQKDDMFEEAARLVVASQFGSTSLLQRKLQLGYNRAGRIMDQLEAAGIVGPYNGSKAREVMVKDEISLNEILHSL